MFGGLGGINCPKSYPFMSPVNESLMGVVQHPFRTYLFLILLTTKLAFIHSRDSLTCQHKSTSTSVMRSNYPSPISPQFKNKQEDSP